MLFKKKCPSCGAKNPKNAVTCAKCGALTELGQAFDKEFQELNEAIHLNPQDNDAYKRRGVPYSCLEQYDRAIADWSKAIELNPYRGEAYANRGLAYTLLGKDIEAGQDIERAKQLGIDRALLEGMVKRAKQIR